MGALDKLNELANKKFEELKQKQSSVFTNDTLRRQATKKSEPGEDALKKINEVFEGKTPAARNAKMNDEAEEFFSKIDALELPPNLSLAVSFIIIGAKDPYKKFESLRKAVEILEDETL